MEELSVDDPTQLLEAASDFAFYPGVQNDDSAKEFLMRFPLPVIINALQTKAVVPGLEDCLVACLERIFKTKYGASMIPHYMPFVQVGLKADSHPVRCLVCKTVTCLLENLDGNTVSAVQLIVDYNVYPLLLDCLLYGDEQVATATIGAIKKLAGFPEGMEIIFPANTNEATHLGNIVSQCSSLGRVRVMALVVKLFSISSSVASVVYNSKLLCLLEEEINKTNDTLVTLSVLELLYELVEVEHGSEFLPRTSFLQLLSSKIRNPSVGSSIRTRATSISGRLLSKDNIFSFVDESSVKTVISAIDGILGSPESQDTDECESALEALGQIGLSSQGANLLLSDSPPAARHVVDAAFDRHVHGKQLAALHALGNISGESRSENNILLNNEAEENLRDLVYQTASKTSKLAPSGIFLSVLRQDSEIRLAVRTHDATSSSLELFLKACHGLIEPPHIFLNTEGNAIRISPEFGYRMITGLVARPWCLMEICSKQDIINIVTDASTETTKIGMEARYNCCKAIHKAFFSSTRFKGDQNLAGIAAKLQEAIRSGPYMAARKQVEAQPVVVTADRF